jgi:hypothetical protein
MCIANCLLNLRYAANQGATTLVSRCKAKRDRLLLCRGAVDATKASWGKRDTRVNGQGVIINTGLVEDGRVPVSSAGKES